MTSMKATVAYGLNYVFYQVPYNGAAATFTVDQSAIVAATVYPASGPTPSLAGTVAGSGTKIITLPAGGAEAGGNVVVCVAHGKSIASWKPDAAV